MAEPSEYDRWVEDGGPAAVVLRQHLVPVDGPDGVFFPATYAPQKDAPQDKEKSRGGSNKDATPDKGKFPGGYNIDVFPDGANVCLVDSVGSQANRIEPIFLGGEYAGLVPQVVIGFPVEGVKLNLLLAHHRAADAIVRYTALADRLRVAFRELDRKNAEPLAKIAPTSLVFGVWDSRDTYVKRARLVRSEIRAFNVRALTRSANFLTQMTVDLERLGILPGAGSEEGLANALSTKNPGGVQLLPGGFIRRDAILTLAALRQLAVREADGTPSTDRTRALRQYLLGLALVALTAPQDTFLRQGCDLVPDVDKPSQLDVVNADGTKSAGGITHEAALKYAKARATAFGVGSGGEVAFDPALAEQAAEAKPDKVEGTVVAVDPAARTFQVRAAKGKGTTDVPLTADGNTAFRQGKKGATLEQVVAMGAKVMVEHRDGVAVAVTLKKK